MTGPFWSVAVIGVNILMVNIATEMLEITRLAASGGIAIIGLMSLAGMLLALILHRMGMGSFLMHGLAVLLLGFAVLLLAYMRNQVSVSGLS